MSVYIPGIETSETCAFCHFCDGIADTQLGAFAYCVVDGKAREADTTPKDCPLIPVPDHGRLIDGDALLNDKGVGTQIAGWGKMYHETAIEYAPTIIPEDKEGQ